MTDEIILLIVILIVVVGLAGSAAPVAAKPALHDFTFVHVYDKASP